MHKHETKANKLYCYYDPCLQMEQSNDLRTLFPNLDPDLCENVLRECGNDFDKALNSLLEISDPSAKTIASPTQTDEALARNLQDRFYAEQLEAEMNREDARIQSQAQEEEEEEETPFMDKLANFGEATKKKFREIYDKMTHKDGPIALK